MLAAIPNPVSRFGGPDGLAAALSLVWVGAYHLGTHWIDLVALFAGTSPFRAVSQQIKDLETQIDELKKKDVKLREDQALLDEAKRKLDGLKNGLAEWETPQSGQTTADAKAGKRLQDLGGECGLSVPELMATTAT
jgi:hypothetical protein